MSFPTSQAVLGTPRTMEGRHPADPRHTTAPWRAALPKGRNIRLGGSMLAATCCRDSVKERRRRQHAVGSSASKAILRKNCNAPVSAGPVCSFGLRTWLSVNWPSSIGTLTLLLLLGLSSLPSCSCVTQQRMSSSHSYGIVVDAGSSGTRMRIYQWDDRADCTKLPDFVEVVNEKRTPGISSYVDNVDGLGDYMAELLTIAREQVPEREHSHTPLYVMATAGMRLLLEPNANAVMNKINSLLLDDTFNPFMYEPRNTRILSGEEEGSFAWIAVNYLRGVFSEESVESAGILELGGASTQIAFLPEGAILADKWPMKIAKKSYALYVHSYLFYGQELTVRWVKQHIVRTGPANATHLINPCMLKGDNRTETQLGREVTFIGASDPDGCQKIVDIFVYKAPEYNCHPKPCAISTVYQPTIDPNKRFYALSAFLFNLRDINALDENGGFTPRGTATAARAYCSKTFNQVKEEIGGNEAFLSSNCVMGLYMPTLFTKGYGFAEDSESIIAIKKLKDTSLEWSLGAIIYEHQLKDRICRPVEAPVCASSAPASSRVGSSAFLLWVTLGVLLQVGRGHLHHLLL